MRDQAEIKAEDLSERAHKLKPTDVSVGRSTIYRQESSQQLVMEVPKLEKVLRVLGCSYEEFIRRAAIEWHWQENADLRMAALKGMMKLTPTQLARIATQIEDMLEEVTSRDAASLPLNMPRVAKRSRHSKPGKAAQGE